MEYWDFDIKGAWGGEHTPMFVNTFPDERQWGQQMSVAISKMLTRLTNVAKDGAKTNIEKNKAKYLIPIAIMAIAHTDEVKMARINVQKDSQLKDALQACLTSYNAYSFAFVMEGKGTNYPEALLQGKGDFDSLPMDDKYEFVTLQTGAKGLPSIFMEKASIGHSIDGRVLNEWADITISSDSNIYTIDWKPNG
jgi:hypothetical protein